MTRNWESISIRETRESGMIRRFNCMEFRLDNDEKTAECFLGKSFTVSKLGMKTTHKLYVNDNKSRKFSSNIKPTTILNSLLKKL